MIIKFCDKILLIRIENTLKINLKLSLFDENTSFFHWNPQVDLFFSKLIINNVVVFKYIFNKNINIKKNL